MWRLRSCLWLLSLGSTVFETHALTISTTSSPFTVWDSLNSECAKRIPGGKPGKPAIDLPDTPVNAFSDDGGTVHLVSADTTSRISTGSSLLRTTRNCSIVMNSTLSPDPALYATDEFLDGTWAFPNGTVYSLLHVEYPGMNFGRCDGNGTTYPYCWTVAMTLSVSHDWGSSWQHAREPPDHMVAAPPYRYHGSATTPNAGWGDSSGITRSPTDGFFYSVAHNRFAEGLQGNGSCVMRTRDISNPRSWRGWGGETRGFTVVFASPYAATAPSYDPSQHICTPLDLPDCVVMGVVWSTYLERFVASLSCGDTNGGDGFGGKVGSVKSAFFSTSVDMVHWEGPQVLYTPPAAADIQFYSYPKLIDPDAPARGDRNFETIGRTATVTFVTVTDNFFTEGRQIMGVNVSFTK